jgi:tetratricopeptide (TPR) repeat protein
VVAAGEADAWRNLGLVLEELGDLAGAMRAYRGAAAAGDATGWLGLAFLLREQGSGRRR